MSERDFTTRAFTVGFSGPPGSGKTSLLLALCRALGGDVALGVVTTELTTTEDAERLVGARVVPAERLRAVTTGGSPSVDAATLRAIDELMRAVRPELVLVERLGGSLEVACSAELFDYVVCVVDAAGGEQVIRKGGAVLTDADLLVVNKTDLAAPVGAQPERMAADALARRAGKPTSFTQASSGVGVEEVVSHLLGAWREAVLRAAQGFLQPKPS